MIHLDTNFIIGAISDGSAHANQVDIWLLAGEQIAVCSIAWAELICGPISPSQVTKAEAIAQLIEPLTKADAARGAELFNLSGRKRGSLADCLIAAAALRHGASLATDNVADFRAFTSLGLVLVP
jgi:predicted nucleic acid-binding protein